MEVPGDVIDELFEIMDRLMICFGNITDDTHKRDIIAEKMKILHKEFEKLKRNYDEEVAYLMLSNKASSNKLNRILSKLIVLRDNNREILTNLQ